MKADLTKIPWWTKVAQSVKKSPVKPKEAKSNIVRHWSVAEWAKLTPKQKKKIGHYGR